MKGILFSSGRYIEGVLFVTELKVYERDLFCPKWYIKSKGSNLGAEPPRIKIFSTPLGNLLNSAL